MLLWRLANPGGGYRAAGVDLQLQTFSPRGARAECAARYLRQHLRHRSGAVAGRFDCVPNASARRSSLVLIAVLFSRTAFGVHSVGDISNKARRDIIKEAQRENRAGAPLSSMKKAGVEFQRCRKMLGEILPVMAAGINVRLVGGVPGVEN